VNSYTLWMLLNRNLKKMKLRRMLSVIVLVKCTTEFHLYKVIYIRLTYVGIACCLFINFTAKVQVKDTDKKYTGH